METTFTWSIQQNGLNVAEINGSMDTVIRVDFKLEASDGVETAELFNCVDLQPPSSDSFIPFSELTEEVVIEWVKSSIPENRLAQFKKILGEMIGHKKKAALVITQKNAPWVSQEG